MGRKGKYCFQVHNTRSINVSTRLFPITKFMFSGQPVKMSGNKLQTQCVSTPSKTVLATCFNHDQLIGHTFASTWEFDGGMYVDMIVCTFSWQSTQVSLGGSPSLLWIRFPQVLHCNLAPANSQGSSSVPTCYCDRIGLVSSCCMQHFGSIHWKVIECYDSHRLFSFTPTLTPLWLIFPTLVTHRSHTHSTSDSPFSHLLHYDSFTPIVLLIYIQLDTHL